MADSTPLSPKSRLPGNGPGTARADQIHLIIFQALAPHRFSFTLREFIGKINVDGLWPAPKRETQVTLLVTGIYFAAAGQSVE
jgi:hypothetical protein